MTVKRHFTGNHEIRAAEGQQMSGYSLRVDDLTRRTTSDNLKAENNKANRAGWWNTLRGSNPTLVIAVNGLYRIIQDAFALVLCGIYSPADSRVGRGCFVVPVGGGAANG